MLKMYSRFKNKDVSAEMFCAETHLNALQFSSGYETLKAPKQSVLKIILSSEQRKRLQNGNSRLKLGR